ncbi:unnamed protein product [Echinostoma caproni]|uniref:CRAL-TRIO domain-containing protein n=1 Tax=Echinostoma caproni TaxID=27848 RepID=A0A183BDA9_9TREM|nr:unnamed protein product [Echinostoma caproni]
MSTHWLNDDWIIFVQCDAPTKCAVSGTTIRHCHIPLWTRTLRRASWSPTLLSQDEMRTLNNMTFECCMLDERCQIGGFALFIDMSSTSMEQATQWAELKSAKSVFKLLQEASPGRVKHLIFYKESKVFDVAFKLIEMWISDKMRERVRPYFDHTYIHIYTHNPQLGK